MSMIWRGALGSVLIVFVLVGVGCHITNYPVITDSRGDYEGIIRTGHKAYTFHTEGSQLATIWSDGSDEAFSMISQNQYGDQMIYTFNNFDPTASVLWMDQTYCDWRYEGCAIGRSWNPASGPDDPFDYLEYGGMTGCSGARSLCMLLSYNSRNGECGDLLIPDLQTAAAEFAQLPVTSFRGEEAYLLPINAGIASFTLTGQDGSVIVAPIYGNHNMILTKDLRMVYAATPNLQHQISWLRRWVADHGKRVDLEVAYGSLTGTVELALDADGLAYNASRF